MRMAREGDENQGSEGRLLRRWARGVVQAGVEHSPWRARLFWRVPFPVKGVALTFDDGPDPANTERILDALAAAGGRASFFLLGERAREMPDLAARIFAEGHTVGNHTYSHRRC